MATEKAFLQEVTMEWRKLTSFGSTMAISQNQLYVICAWDHAGLMASDDKLELPCLNSMLACLERMTMVTMIAKKLLPIGSWLVDETDPMETNLV